MNKHYKTFNLKSTGLRYKQKYDFQIRCKSLFTSGTWQSKTGSLPATVDQSPVLPK